MRVGRVVLEAEGCRVRVAPAARREGNALEGLIIKRTVAAAARALSSRVDGVHCRGARATLCNQLLKPLSGAPGGAPTLRWRERGGQ